MALAHAEARAGVIPNEAAAAIKRPPAPIPSILATQGRDRQRRLPDRRHGHQLAKQCGEAGRYVHWGATTQDIMDSGDGAADQARPVISSKLIWPQSARALLSGQKHRTTVMAGRTHLQHALPVTFGYKAAVWLA